MKEVHENQSKEVWNKSKKYKAYQHMTSRSLFVRLLKCVTSVFIAPNCYTLLIYVKYFDIKDTYFLLPMSFKYFFFTGEAGSACAAHKFRCNGLSCITLAVHGTNIYVVIINMSLSYFSTLKKTSRFMT